MRWSSWPGSTSRRSASSRGFFWAGAAALPGLDGSGAVGPPQPPGGAAAGEVRVHRPRQPRGPGSDDGAPQGGTPVAAPAAAEALDAAGGEASDLPGLLASLAARDPVPRKPPSSTTNSAGCATTSTSRSGGRCGCVCKGTRPKRSPRNWGSATSPLANAPHAPPAATPRGRRPRRLAVSRAHSKEKRQGRGNNPASVRREAMESRRDGERGKGMRGRGFAGGAGLADDACLDSEPVHVNDQLAITHGRRTTVWALLRPNPRKHRTAEKPGRLTNEARREAT